MTGLEIHLNSIIEGNCLNVLKQLQDNSIDCGATDPPYGLAFMGKDWDKAVPSVEIWQECLRVLKPGAFMFVMCAPRQDVLAQMIVRLGQAGFDTNFTSIYWTFASGFPKAANVGKLVDKRLGAEREVIETKTYTRSSDASFAWQDGQKRSEAFKAGEHSYDITKPASEQAKALDGSYAGFQPKPAVEVIIVVMKPLSEKSYTDQALANGKGITWLDEARIPFESEADAEQAHENALGPVERFDTKHRIYEGGKQSAGFTDTFNPKGRFPANLLVSDGVLNDGEDHKSGTFEPHHVLDNDKTSGGIYGKFKSNLTAAEHVSYGDSGSFSRFFDLDAWTARNLPFLIEPKAAQSEKNKGLSSIAESMVNDGRSVPPDNPFQRGKSMRKNTHPTVKPIQLMSYLITMGSRIGDVVLDPFCGSGSTCIAAKLLRRNYVGIELNPEYASIARMRLEAHPATFRLEEFVQEPAG